MFTIPIVGELMNFRFGDPFAEKKGRLGIVPRAFAALFQDLKSCQQEASVEYSISYVSCALSVHLTTSRVVEIYNEQLHDLLDLRTENLSYKKLDIREHPRRVQCLT